MAATERLQITATSPRRQRHPLRHWQQNKTPTTCCGTRWTRSGRACTGRPWSRSRRRWGRRSGARTRGRGGRAVVCPRRCDCAGQGVRPLGSRRAPPHRRHRLIRRSDEHFVLERGIAQNPTLDRKVQSSQSGEGSGVGA
jgi:hypothetical protein